MMKMVHVLNNIVRPMACAMLSVYLFSQTLLSMICRVFGRLSFAKQCVACGSLIKKVSCTVKNILCYNYAFVFSYTLISSLQISCLLYLDARVSFFLSNTIFHCTHQKIYCFEHPMVKLKI